MTAIETKSVTKDPICGMIVDEATALQAEREEETFYFCSEQCRQKFLTTPAEANAYGRSGASGG